MGDLISREYMKSLGGACIAQRLKNGDLCPIISIDLLPSVQPELSNNSPELDKEIGELISREEAIKAVKFYETFCDPYPRVIEALEELPSAQPERTCVNCGRTANNGGWYADGGTRCPIEEHYALPKDGYCHLWEKRNVTDDDYLERRTDE